MVKAGERIVGSGAAGEKLRAQVGELMQFRCRRETVLCRQRPRLVLRPLRKEVLSCPSKKGLSRKKGVESNDEPTSYIIKS